MYRPPAVLNRWTAVVPILLVLLAYANALSGGFVWDDHALIENQPQVQQLASPASYFGKMFWSDPLDEARAFYRPVVTLSYALEWRGWGGSPFGFHLTNVLLHCAVVALLYAFARRWGASQVAASGAAALFGVFPRLTESVAWISGRTDVLAALFGLAAILVFDPLKWQRRAGCAALLLLALLCKEVAVVFVFGLAAHELRRGGRKSRRPLLEPALALVAYALLRVAAVSEIVRPQLEHVRGDLPLPERMVAASAAIGTYALMVLDALRPRLQIGSVRAPSTALAIVGAVLLAAAVSMLVARRRSLKPRTVFAVTTGLGALALVIHVIPLDVNVIAADRFLYVPAAMGALLIAWKVSDAPRRTQLAAAVLAALLVPSFAIATHLRNLDWADEYKLWKRAVTERDAFNTRPLFGLAGVLMEAELPERALIYLEQAIEEERAEPELKTFNAWAVCLDKSGRRREAIEWLTKMAAQQPNAARVHLNLAMAFAREGKFEDAKRTLDAVSAQLVPQQTLSSLRALFQRAEDELGAGGLRAGSPAPLPDVERRARLAEELGARPEAQQLYSVVLSTGDATAEQRMRALAYFAFFGDPEQALSKLGSTSGSEVEQLRAVAEERNRMR